MESDLLTFKFAFFAGNKLVEKGWKFQGAIQQAEHLRWRYYRVRSFVPEFSTAQSGQFSNLPEPLLIYIFERLDSKSLRAAKCCCKNWNRIKIFPHSMIPSDEEFLEILKYYLEQLSKQQKGSLFAFYREHDGIHNWFYCWNPSFAVIMDPKYLSLKETLTSMYKVEIDESALYSSPQNEWAKYLKDK